MTTHPVCSPRCSNTRFIEINREMAQHGCDPYNTYDAWRVLNAVQADLEARATETYAKHLAAARAGVGYYPKTTMALAALDAGRLNV